MTRDDARTLLRFAGIDPDEMDAHAAHRDAWRRLTPPLRDEVVCAVPLAYAEPDPAPAPAPAEKPSRSKARR